MGAKMIKRRIFSGAGCEQLVHTVFDGVKNVRDYGHEKVSKHRFKDDATRREHREEISRRTHLRNFCANFESGALYSTLTFGEDRLPKTYEDARRICKNFERTLQRGKDRRYDHLQCCPDFNGFESGGFYGWAGFEE